MPSARNTKSTAGESEDTSSDGNGGERPFPTWAHRPSAVLCDTPSAKVGVFLALSSPTFQRHCHCTAFCGIPSSKVGVSMAISSPTFRKRCPYTALCGTPPAKVWYFSRFSPLPPDGLASASRTAEGPVLYRTCLKAARVQQKGSFLYRTENRPEVIEL